MSYINRLLIVTAFLGWSLYGSSQDLILNIGDGCGEVGDSICVDITSDMFMDMVSMEFDIRYDHTLLDLNAVIVENSCLNNQGQGEIFGSSAINATIPGEIKVVWIDNSTTGASMAPGCILFQICFTILDGICETPDLTWVEESLFFEKAINDLETMVITDYEVTPGEIVIKNDDFVIDSRFCSSSDTDDSGSITFSFAGGQEPYSYTVAPIGAMGTGVAGCEDVTIDDLAPGTYTITYTDALGVVNMKEIDILTNSTFPFTVDLLGVDPSCFDRDNGSVSVAQVNGGEGPFDYAWSNAVFDTDINDELLSGDYEITVTDVNGCTTTAAQSINVDTLRVEYQVISPPGCDGGFGTVQFTIEGGRPEPDGTYTLDINALPGTFYIFPPTPVQSPFTLNNFPEGCFEVFVADSSSPSCSSDAVEFCLSADDFTGLNLDSISVSCAGVCDGAIVLEGRPLTTYNYALYDNTNTQIDTVGGVTDHTFMNLCGGNYTIAVYDVDADCSLDTMITVLEPEQLILSVLDSMGPGCGGGDGFINFDTLGGTSPISFVWNDNFGDLSRDFMMGGDYGVTITDGNGCQDSVNFTFLPGGDIGLNAFVCQAIGCAGDATGSICATVTASGTYTFSWEDEDGLAVGIGTQVDNLASGTYYVTATDGDCVATDSVFIVDGQKPSVTTSQVGPDCFDSAATFTASPDAGNVPFMYEWTQPPSTTVLSNGQVLNGTIGTYNLHIIDANGCEADTLLTIVEPPNLISIDTANVQGTPCFDQCLGSATILVSGGPLGTGDYSIFLNNNAISVLGGSIVLNDLCPGEQVLVASDATCLSDTFRFTIPQGPQFGIDSTASMFVDPSCPGDDNGSIDLVVDGAMGTMYTYTWPDLGVNGPSVSNLFAGDYTVNISGDDGCVFNEVISLVEPEPLEVEINQFGTQQINCSNDNNGLITLNVDGGNPGGYNYVWSPEVSTDSIAINLGPGIYSVTVSDSEGCSDEISYMLDSADPVTAVIVTPEEPPCFGQQTCISVESASGGVSGPYNFQVNVGVPFPIDSCVAVFAGTYNITVTDSTGCPFDTTIMIGQPAQIIVDAGPDIEIDLGQESDPVSAFIVSELDIDSIVWTPGTNVMCQTTDCQVVTFNPLNTSTYTVFVTDENGCTASDEIEVTVDLRRNVYFPNIFSPNGDNQNDDFQLTTGFGVNQVDVFRIYNRWGSLIYFEEDYMPNDTSHKGWDGTYNGRDLQPDVYVYYAEVTFDDGVKVVYKGSVTLIR